jgi:hypothetical protein
MKVFLSSTYNDLIEHRRATHDALEHLGLHVIWMEAFGACPVESTKAYLDEIEGSDLFIGVYAHRYGYVPKDADISITARSAATWRFPKGQKDLLNRILPDEGGITIA